MKKSAILLAVTLALCVPFCGCNKSRSAADGGSTDQPIKSDERVSLQPKWVTGSRYVHRMDLVQNTETAVPQMPKPFKQDVTLGQDFSITVLSERPGGGRELEIEILSIEMDQSQNGKQSMAFDSKGESLDDSKNPVAAMFRGMIGSKLKCLLDASNRVEKIEGLQEFMNKVSANAPPQTRALATSTFSEDYFKQLVDPTKFLPAKPVQPGATWSSQPEIGAGPLGTVLLNLNSSFTGWETHEKKKCAHLDFAGTLKSKDNKGPGIMGMKMSLEDGKIAGKSWFDPELGMVVESAIDENMTLHMEVPAQPQARAPNASGTNQVLTIVMKQKVNLKLAEVNQAAK